MCITYTYTIFHQKMLEDRHGENAMVHVETQGFQMAVPSAETPLTLVGEVAQHIPGRLIMSKMPSIKTYTNMYTYIYIYTCIYM